jgi:hypothetical protein|tara:strand:- start:119 stop:397 length:279 start_codon:yes stop_codon:yes gene_type:complete
MFSEMNLLEKAEQYDDSRYVEWTKLSFKLQRAILFDAVEAVETLFKYNATQVSGIKMLSTEEETEVNYALFRLMNVYDTFTTLRSCEIEKEG